MSINILKHKNDKFYLNKKYDIQIIYRKVIEYKLKINSELYLVDIKLKKNIIIFGISENNNFDDFLKKEITEIINHNIELYENQKIGCLKVLKKWNKNEKDFIPINYEETDIYGIYPKFLYKNKNLRLKYEEKLFINRNKYGWRITNKFYEKECYIKVLKKINKCIEEENKKLITLEGIDILRKKILKIKVSLNIEDVYDYISLFTRVQKIDKIINQ